MGLGPSREHEEAISGIVSDWLRTYSGWVWGNEARNRLASQSSKRWISDCMYWRRACSGVRVGSSGSGSLAETWSSSGVDASVSWVGSLGGAMASIGASIGEL